MSLPYCSLNCGLIFFDNRLSSTWSLFLKLDDNTSGYSFSFLKEFQFGLSFSLLVELELALRGGYQVAHLLTRRRVSHFPTHQDFPISRARISSNSRSGFTKNLQFICPLIGWPRQTRENVPCLENIDVKVEWMNQIQKGTKNLEDGEKWLHSEISNLHY